MITFASLFLGLVFGPRPVELVVVDPTVATVELRLEDGSSENPSRLLSRLEGPPWRALCDLGPEIVPARLVAVAFDAGGEEIGSATQWLNLPQPPAVLSGSIEKGPPRVLQLSWESSAGAEPESVRVELDGRVLAVEDPHRIQLPPVDEEGLHLVNVEMEFERGVSARLDLTFGGRWLDTASAEMTALPLRGRRAPSLAEAQELFTVGGEPVRVVSIEKAEAEVSFVLGRPFPHLLDPTQREKVPKKLEIPDDLRLRFVSPAPEHSKGVVTDFSLFPVSPAYDGEIGDLYWMLTRIRPTDKDKERDLGAAVAVAGSGASRSRGRRAVIFLPPSRAAAPDELSPAVVRRYLERLRVPFLVWDPAAGHTPGIETWGEARPVGSMKDLVRAFEELTEDLDEQWIVWLDGRYLPQEVQLRSAAGDFEIPSG